MNGRYRFVPDPDLMLCLHDAELCAHQASDGAMPLSLLSIIIVLTQKSAGKLTRKQLISHGIAKIAYSEY